MAYKRRAFTLVEALLAITIIGIFSTIAIINKSSSDKHEALIKAAKQVEFGIRNAQGQVMGTALDSGNDIPCSRGLYFTAGANKFQSGYEKMRLNTLSCDVNYKFITKKIDEIESALTDINFVNVEVDSIKINGFTTTPVSLIFSPPDPSVYVDGQKGKDLEITLRYTGASCPSDSCKKISVNPFGQVNINN